MKKIILLFSIVFGLVQGGLVAQVIDTNMWVVSGGEVYEIAVDGNYTYIGGKFTYVGPNIQHGAKLTTTNTAPDMAFPKVNGTINIAIPDESGGWYIGGYFTKVGTYTRNNIAHIKADKTVDTTWKPNVVCDYVSPCVYAIAINGNDIYVGGNFTGIGGQAKKYIAKLNNTTGAVDAKWNPNANSDVHTIAISGSDIYVGGYFESIGGQMRNRIAKLNNTTGAADAKWYPNANSSVYTIAISDSDIYVGGYFTSIGGQTRNKIAKLNNTTGAADAMWNPNAGDTSSHIVGEIAISGNDIYVGGTFTSIGGLTRNNIAKLNNTTGAADATWNPNANNGVSTIAISGSDIYVGGSFTSIGGQAKKYIAKLNNTTGAADATWNPNALAYNYPPRVYTIAINGNDIYVGGEFNSIGGMELNKIAKLNNTTGAAYLWGPDADWGVGTIAISGSDIYVAGSFTSIGGQTRNGIAKLNNTTSAADATWNPNANGHVNTIAISGSDIYVGGTFTGIGGQTRNKIAKLNNTTGAADAMWNPNVTNVNGEAHIYSIAISGSDIYVGGWFSSIGNEDRDSFAKISNGNIVGVTEITNAPANSIYIYPNPANTKITIEMGEFRILNTEFRIYNISGQEVRKLQVSSSKLEVNVEDLPNGVYFVKVVNEQGVSIGKFIKN